jgi:hypothetical protein
LLLRFAKRPVHQVRERGPYPGLASKSPTSRARPSGRH